MRQSPSARAVMKLVEPARSAISTKLVVDPLAAVTMPTSSALEEGMAAAMFMAAAGTEAAYVEKYGLPALRLTVSGTRFVVQVPVSATWEYFSRAGVTTGGGDRPFEADALSKLHGGLLQLSREALVDIARRCPVYAATLGPGDLSYTPAGYLTVESVHGKLGSPPTSDVTASASAAARHGGSVCSLRAACVRDRVCMRWAVIVISGLGGQAEFPDVA
ncbi:MAG: hypothetical protein GY772_27000 [bacterium]|nr:hypothetical protein [bacterium]